MCKLGILCTFTTTEAKTAHNLLNTIQKFTKNSYFDFTFYLKKINIIVLKKDGRRDILLNCTIMGSMPFSRFLIIIRFTQNICKFYKMER